MKNLLIRLLCVAFLSLALFSTALSQEEDTGPGSPINPDEEVAVPIDDGMVLLLIAGLGYGLKMAFYINKKVVLIK